MKKIVILFLINIALYTNVFADENLDNKSGDIDFNNFEYLDILENDENIQANEDIDNNNYNLYTDSYMSGKYLIPKNSSIESSIYNDYLKNGNNPEESINIILTAYNSLNIDSPYEIFLLGYKILYGEKNRLSCTDDLTNGKVLKNVGYNEYYKDVNNKEKYVWRNRAMLKARDILNLEIERNNTGNNNEYYLFIGLSYLVENSLYEYDKIYENFAKFVNNNSQIDNVINERINVDSNKNINFKDFLNAVMSFKDKNIIEVFDVALKNNFINEIAPKTQLVDFYNDGFYHRVDISKFEKYSTVIAYDNLLIKNKDYILPRYYKLLNKDISNNNNNIKYPAQHCTNNVYLGNIFVIPFNNIVYIVNTTDVDNKIKSVEVRNSAYFNLDYRKEYFSPFIFSSKEDIAMYKVSSISSFNYKNKFIYKKEMVKEPQSPIGDLEKVKDVKGNPITPLGMYDELKIKYFHKDYLKKTHEYLKYLKENSGIELANDLVFYNVDLTNDGNTILAKSSYESSSYKSKNVYFIVNKSDLKINNKEINNILLKEVKKDRYIKTLIYKSHSDNKKYYAIVNDDNTVNVINIQGNKFGVGEFPIYFYKESNEYEMWTGKLINKYMPDKSEFNILHPNYDCSNTKNEIKQTICSDRMLISAKAYIDLLFKNKMIAGINNNYPKSILTYYKDSYINTMEELSLCNTDNLECYFNKIMSLENVLKQ